MIQFNLKYPNNDKIYFSKTPKNAAKKAFSDLKMSTNGISRIIVTDNNSKKDYEFLALTDKKINELTSIYGSRNPIQLGGSKNINDDQFYDKINEISGNINLSVSELSKILSKKYKPNNNNIMVLLQEGISKINNINDNISIIAQSVADKKRNNTKNTFKIDTSDESPSENNQEIESTEEINENVVPSKLEEISEESIDISTIDIKNNITNDINTPKLQSQKGCIVM